MNKLGFSVIVNDETSVTAVVELLDAMLTAGCEAIELHLMQSVSMSQAGKNRLFAAISKFSYRSIHASHLTTPEQSADIRHYQDLLRQIDAQAIIIHPDGMAQWRWLIDAFGSLASFENMDCEKDFGQTPSDMRTVFDDAPQAQWTFDLNHVYSNDKNMQTIDEFYGLSDRLAHYHVSGYGGPELPHTTLHNNNQDSILHSIRTDHPIIIESYGVDDIADFRDELVYVRRLLLS